MTTPRPPLSDFWMEGLDFRQRLPPELFRCGDDVRDTPYVSAVRAALEELSLSAVFCVNRVPTVVFRQSNEFDPYEVRRIHAALWNQGLASILVDLTDDSVRVFSLARVGTGSDDTRLEASCLLKAMGAATSTLKKLRGLISGAETGRLWEEQSQYFRPKERIDAVLLHNLDAAHHLLQTLDLSKDQAAAVLIQTMFVAYLEDRQIINPHYFLNVTDDKYEDWSSLLGSGDVPAMEVLFSELNGDFNGDLFVAPCSLSDTSDIMLTAEHLQVLKRFRLGKERMTRGGRGQLRFWGYDFRYIPVELISEVYDRFLRMESASQHDVGAHYTPMFLADTVVSSTWSLLTDGQKNAGQFFDPACGSGIFLVKSFQRLCQHWRERHRDQEKIPWDTLVQILDRVRGQDINQTAVRISAFSLYLALLEQVQPSELRALLSADHRLPTLWNRTLAQIDFFEDDNVSHGADVVIGNPPWSSRKGDNATYVQWSRARRYPIPNKETAWAFTWKGLERLRDGGVLAFLLPAMGFLHNQTANTIEARVRLFKTAHVRLVADLSDLRFQLFASAVRPATLVVMSKPHDALKTSYEFTYLTPKADLNLRARRSISLTSQCRVHLRSSDLVSNGRLLKQRLWMRGPESALFNYLSGLPRLAEFVKPYTAGYGATRWLLGEGFQPWNPGRTSGRPVESKPVGANPHLPVDRLTPLSVDLSGLPAWHSSETRRRGFEAAYCGTRILVRRGISIGSGRLQAAFVTEPLTFRHAVMGITVPPGAVDTGKFMTAYLNSRLALWFAFHGTVSLGADRPEINPMDLVELPLPGPRDLADSEGAEETRGKLIDLVDRRLSSTPNILSSQTEQDSILAEIDRLVYAYFNLNDDEVALVNEVVESVLPAAQPSRGAVPRIWHESSPNQRREYAGALGRRLADWFPDTPNLGVRMIARNDDFAIIELSLEPTPGTNAYSESSSTAFSQTLTGLTSELPNAIGGNFMLTPDVRIFEGRKLYLIKPLQRRFWLLSAALADADAIVEDLDIRWRRTADRTAAS